MRRLDLWLLVALIGGLAWYVVREHALRSDIQRQKIAAEEMSRISDALSQLIAQQDVLTRALRRAARFDRSERSPREAYAHAKSEPGTLPDIRVAEPILTGFFPHGIPYKGSLG
jgi:hypothetical protein